MSTARPYSKTYHGRAKPYGEQGLIKAFPTETDKSGRIKEWAKSETFNAK
jgi:hypothetical protein